MKMIRIPIVARKTASAPIAAILDHIGGRVHPVLVATDVVVPI